MGSIHHRSASNNDRRSGTFAGPTSRVNSTRARDYERPSTRESASPIISDAYASGQDGANGFASPDRVIERRREKNTITTTERLTTRRSPRKDQERNNGRDDMDRQRRSVVSPIQRGKQKEEVIGRGLDHVHGSLLTFVQFHGSLWHPWYHIHPRRSRPEYPFLHCLRQPRPT
jgi:hypothetical protein